jgi:hypothetical protein
MNPQGLSLKVQNKNCPGGLNGMLLEKKINLVYKKLKLNVKFSSQIDHCTGKRNGIAV